MERTRGNERGGGAKGVGKGRGMKMQNLFTSFKFLLRILRTICIGI